MPPRFLLPRTRTGFGAVLLAAGFLAALLVSGAPVGAGPGALGSFGGLVASASGGRPAAAGDGPSEPRPLALGTEIVVLVHGWQGLGDVQLHCADGPVPYRDAPEASRFEALPEWLLGDGFEPWIVRLDSGPEGTPSLADNAECLAGQLAIIRQRTGAHQVALVGHSMGGIVARAYVEDPDLYAGDVSVLATLGSPHEGIPVDLEIALANFLGFSARLHCEEQPALCEFTRGGMTAFNRLHPQRTPGVSYRVVSGDIAFFDATWIGRAMSAWIDGADDGIVPTSSGLGLPGVGGAVATDESHGGEVLSVPLADRSYFLPRPGTTQSRTYRDCLLPLLRGKADACRGAAPRSLGLNAEQASPALARSPVIAGRIDSGGSVAIPIVLDGDTTATIAAAWDVADVSVTLTDPMGNPASRGTLQAAQSRRVGPTDDKRVGQTFDVTTSKPGTWTLRLHSAAPVPVGYGVLVAATGPTVGTLSLATDAASYAPGATMHVTVSAHGLAPTAVTVTLTAAGGSSAWPLAPTGSNTFEGLLPAPGEPSSALLTAVANTPSGGGTTRRLASATVLTRSDAYRLDGLKTADIVDLDGNGRADHLAVVLWIDAAQSGRVGVSARLEDAAGRDLGRAGRTVSLPLGAGEAALLFDGRPLANLGAGVRLRVADIAVDDLSHGVPLPSDAAEALLTPPLDLTPFRYLQPLYLPSLSAGPDAGAVLAGTRP